MYKSLQVIYKANIISQEVCHEEVQFRRFVSHPRNVHLVFILSLQGIRNSLDMMMRQWCKIVLQVENARFVIHPRNVHLVFTLSLQGIRNSLGMMMWQWCKIVLQVVNASYVGNGYHRHRYLTHIPQYFVYVGSSLSCIKKNNVAFILIIKSFACIARTHTCKLRIVLRIVCLILHSN